MDSRYIRAQALTFTKAHDERHGPLKGVANSIKRYGHSLPQIVFSDDPVKVSSLLFMLKVTANAVLFSKGHKHANQCISLSQGRHYTYGSSIWSFGTQAS